MYTFSHPRGGNDGQDPEFFKAAGSPITKYPDEIHHDKQSDEAHKMMQEA